MKRVATFFGGALMLALLACCGTGPRFDARATTQARLAALTNLAPVTVTNAADASFLQPPSARFTLGPGDGREIFGRCRGSATEFCDPQRPGFTGRFLPAAQGRRHDTKHFSAAG